VVDVDELVEEAGLVYVEDTESGILRRRRGKGFSFHRPDGSLIREQRILERIRSLVLPPAWEQVWICENPRGHLQATGIDQAGRKQYRYHDRWAEIRNETKYDHLIEFAEALPALRRRVGRDFAEPCHTKTRMCALAVAILDRAHIRIGNDCYLESNNTRGLTTLEPHHVDISGPMLHFQFRAKGGDEHSFDLRDERLAKAVRQCQQLPGQFLFTYRDKEEEYRPIESHDVNEYLREVVGEGYTAKTFRTWGGTVHAVDYLLSEGDRDSPSARKAVRVAAVKKVAADLGNTPATCRKYYIHPFVLEAYEEGEFFQILKRRRRRKAWKGLRKVEVDTLKLLVTHREENGA
jgi:DNA topoisomerase-1